MLAREANGEDAEVFAKPLPAGILVVGLGCCADSPVLFPSDSIVAFASDAVCEAVSVLVVSSTLLRFVFGLSSDLVKSSASVVLTTEADGAEC